MCSHVLYGWFLQVQSHISHIAWARSGSDKKSAKVIIKAEEYKFWELGFLNFYVVYSYRIIGYFLFSDILKRNLPLRELIPNDCLSTKLIPTMTMTGSREKLTWQFCTNFHSMLVFLIWHQICLSTAILNHYLISRSRWTFMLISTVIFYSGCQWCLFESFGSISVWISIEETRLVC